MIPQDDNGDGDVDYYDDDDDADDDDDYYDDDDDDDDDINGVGENKKYNPLCRETKMTNGQWPTADGRGLLAES